MRSAALAILIPSATAVVAVLGLVAWTTSYGVGGLAMRLPGMDRPAVEEATPAAPLVGTFTAGTARPSAVPGAWPRFRGERFDNVVDPSVPLARSWPEEGPRRLWSIALGEGHAGAAVRDGRVYVLDYDRQAEADVLRCLSLDDGQEIWRYASPVKIKRNHGMSRTVPAVSDEFVVALGPKCHVMCLDAKTGQCHWLKDLVREFGATVPPWYAGQCPVIDGDRAILAPGGDALVMALDCRSGEVVWKSPNPRGWTMTHASIMPMEFAGRKMYIYCGSGGVAGVAADDGTLLWDTTDWKISIATVPSPVILPEGKIFFSGGYNSGALMLQLEPKDERITTRALWRLKPNRFGSEQQTPIFYEGHLFGIDQRTEQLVCMDLAGNRRWASGPRRQFGLGPYLIADGLIFALAESGLLVLAEATPEEFRPLAQAQVLSGHDAWGPMAMVHGRLLARDLTEMVCLDVSAEAYAHEGDSPLLPLGEGSGVRAVLSPIPTFPAVILSGAKDLGAGEILRFAQNDRGLAQNDRGFAQNDSVSETDAGVGNGSRLPQSHARPGTGPFFGQSARFAQQASSENMDLSPSASQGGQSRFRGDWAVWQCNVTRATKMRQSPVK